MDSHCHVGMTLEKRKVTLNEFLKDTNSKNSVGVIANFIRPLNDWSRVHAPKISPILEMCASNPNVGVTVGCHPHYANDMKATQWNDLNKIVSGQVSKIRPVGLGEIGLDTSPKNNVKLEIQKNVFIDQLKMADHHQLPIVLHFRQTSCIGLDILRNTISSDTRIHLHCYDGTPETAQEYIQIFRNCKFGVTGAVSYNNKKSENLKNVIRSLPIENIICETDAPFMPLILSERDYSLPRDIND